MIWLGFDILDWQTMNKNVLVSTLECQRAIKIAASVLEVTMLNYVAWHLLNQFRGQEFNRSSYILTNRIPWLLKHKIACQTIKWLGFFVNGLRVFKQTLIHIQETFGAALL